jgi:hypothetical protein
MWAHHWCVISHYCTNAIPDHCGTMSSNSDCRSFLHKCDLKPHCCAIMGTLESCCATMGSNNDPWLCRLLTPVGEIPQIDMDWSITFSSLMLECEEHRKMGFPVGLTESKDIQNYLHLHCLHHHQFCHCCYCFWHWVQHDMSFKQSFSTKLNSLLITNSLSLSWELFVPMTESLSITNSSITSHMHHRI